MKYILSFLAVALMLYDYDKIRKGSRRVVKLIYFELLYNLVIKFLIGSLGLTSMLNYVTDAVLIWILAEFMYQKGEKRIPLSLVICASLLWVSSILSYALNVYSPLLYLWGFRNNFRFILYAMMCAAYLRKRDIETIMDILYGFFLLNILVVTYQFFFVSYSESAIGDFISVLFSNGARRGGNASLDWLMCIVTTYAIVKYLNKTGSLKNAMICIAGSLYMASLAEIKLYFLQLVMIGLLSILICKKSFKSFGFALLGIIGLFIGIQFLYWAFPKFADFFNMETIIGYVTKSGGYSSRGYSSGVDRATAFSYVLEHFLHTFSQRVFGIGLGNADFSSFAALTSEFYRRNSWSGYMFFSSSFVTVELGILGFILYATYFANYIRFSAKKVQTKSALTSAEKSVLHTVIIIGLMSFVMILSNQTMKMETSAYMVNCVLTFAFVVCKDNDSSEAGQSLISDITRRKKNGI